MLYKYIYVVYYIHFSSCCGIAHFGHDATTDPRKWFGVPSNYDANWNSVCGTHLGTLVWEFSSKKCKETIPWRWWWWWWWWSSSSSSSSSSMIIMDGRDKNHNKSTFWENTWWHDGYPLSLIFCPRWGSFGNMPRNRWPQVLNGYNLWYSFRVSNGLPYFSLASYVCI